jgi:hypothetical protein
VSIEPLQCLTGDSVRDSFAQNPDAVSVAIAYRLAAATGAKPMALHLLVGETVEVPAYSGFAGHAQHLSVGLK